MKYLIVLPLVMAVSAGFSLGLVNDAKQAWRQLNVSKDSAYLTAGPGGHMGCQVSVSYKNNSWPVAFVYMQSDGLSSPNSFNRAIFKNLSTNAKKQAATFLGDFALTPLEYNSYGPTWVKSYSSQLEKWCNNMLNP